MERWVANFVKIDVVKDEEGLRSLGPSVRQAFLDGELMSRYGGNPDGSVGGWLSRGVEINSEGFRLGETAIIRGHSTIRGECAVGNGTTIADSAVESSSIGKDCRLDEGRIEFSVIGNNVEAEKHAWISGSKILDNCSTGRGADIVRSFIGGGVYVGNLTTVKESVVGGGTEIGDYVLMNESAVLGDNAIRDAVVMENATVWRGMEIGKFSVVEFAIVELMRRGSVPANSIIKNDIIHSDLPVSKGPFSNLIDPPEDLIPVGGGDELVDQLRELDNALGIKRG